MDIKDLQNDVTLGERSNDGSKYASSGVTLPYNRNKPYQDVNAVSLGKVDTQTTRPCAVIGPDRVMPPPVSNDTLKKSAYDTWYAENAYRHPPEYPHKMTNYNTPIRNISPRQTFQENMQRIMVPPTYNSLKSNEEHHFSMDKNVALPKNIKSNIPLETKYCEVPYTGNITSNDQKSVRNIEQCVSNVNPVLGRSAPQGWSSHVRPTRPYGAPELYQYPDYTNCAGPRPVPISRSHRTLQEDSSHGYLDPYGHDGNIRFKPYATVKDRYPPARYEFISNYPNPFHPPSPFPTHKYDMQKSIPQPYAYPQVPLKYLDSRIPDPLMDGYPRPVQQSNYNLPFHNQMIHSAYGSVLGSCIQNKFPCPPEGSVKSVAPNKQTYESNKMYAEYENARSKGMPVSENYYFNEMQRPPHHLKSQVIPNYAGNMHGIPPHPYYRKESSSLKNYEYMPHFRNIDPSMLTQSRIPTQFSPNAITIAPSDTNLSMDPTQIQVTSQEDCGYVSQSPTASIRSMEYVNRPTNEFYRRYDSRYGPNIRPPPMMHKPEQNSNGNSKDKKDIDVRQFLQMWNEVDDENAENPTKEVVAQLLPTEVNKAPKQYETIKSQDQLYVLGLVNVPSEELGKYEHIQKVSKLPENIKGYNSIELLNQFEEVIESSNSFKSKPSNSRDVSYPMSLKNSGSHSLGMLPRPVSPLDVEAKISQSVIHKDVGCNFEIKPCSPKMLNVEAATPIQNLLGERSIEKVSNPITVTPPVLHESILNHPEQIKSPNEDVKKSSCKMTNTQFHNNESVRSNYSLQDLESNSGVCLASLPRLDTDIELNFPEVNQQFINANKGESVITTTKDLPSLINLDNVENVSSKPSETEQPDTSYEFPSITDPEREFSKLSKYRKHKKFGPDSIEKGTSFISTQNMRTDSVIIKNPDNQKMYEQSKEVVLNAESALDQDKIIPNKDNFIDKVDTDTEFSNKLDYGEIGSQMDIAIDFSLNKNDNNNSVSNAIEYYIGNQSNSQPTKINKTKHGPKMYNIDFQKDQNEENYLQSISEPVNAAELLMNDNILKQNKQIDVSDVYMQESLDSVVNKNNHKDQGNKNIDEMKPLATSPSKVCEVTKNGNKSSKSGVQKQISNENDDVENNTNEHSTDIIHVQTMKDREYEIDRQFITKNHLDSSECTDDSAVAIHSKEYLEANDDTFEFFSENDNGNPNSSNICELDKIQAKSCIENDENKMEEIIQNIKTQKNMNKETNVEIECDTKVDYNDESMNKNIENKNGDKINASFNSPIVNLQKELNNCDTFENGEILKDSDSQLISENNEMLLKSINQCKENVSLLLEDTANKISPHCECDPASDTSIELNKSANIHKCKYLNIPDFFENVNNKVNEDLDTKLMSENKKHVKAPEKLKNNTIENKHSDDNDTEISQNIEKYEESTQNEFVNPSTIPLFDKKVDNLFSEGPQASEIETDELLVTLNDQLTNMNSKDNLVKSIELGNNPSNENVCFENNINEKIIASANKKIEGFNAVVESIETKENNTEVDEINEFETNDKSIETKSFEDEKALVKNNDTAMTENLYANQTSFNEKCTENICATSFQDNTSLHLALDNYKSNKNKTLEILGEPEAKLVSVKQKQCLGSTDKSLPESSIQENELKYSEHENKDDKTDETKVEVMECNEESKVSSEESSFSETPSMMVGSVLENLRSVDISLITHEDSNLSKSFTENSNAVSCRDDHILMSIVNKSNDLSHSYTDLSHDTVTSLGDVSTMLTPERCVKVHHSDTNYSFNSSCAPNKSSVQNVETTLENNVKEEKHLEDSDVKLLDIVIDNQQIGNKNRHEKKEYLATCTLKKEMFSPFMQKLIYGHTNHFEDKLLKTKYFKSSSNDPIDVDCNSKTSHALKSCNITEKTFDENNTNTIDNKPIEGSIFTSGNKCTNLIYESSTISNDHNMINSVFDARDSSEVAEKNTRHSSIELLEANPFKNNLSRCISNEYTPIISSVFNESSEAVDISVPSSSIKEPEVSENDLSVTNDTDHDDTGYDGENYSSCNSVNVSGTEIDVKVCLNNDCNIECIPNIEASNDLLGKKSDKIFFDTNRPRLKRSLSDSALDSLNDNSDSFYTGWQPKRAKRNFRNILKHDIIFEPNRRKSISSVYNEQNVSFCILIENDCIITEEADVEPDQVCITEISENCLTGLQESVNEYDTIVSPHDCAEESNYEFSELQEREEKSFEESWVDDVGCVETVVSDVAEDITISASSSPERLLSPENDESGIFMSSDHTDKVKHIYGDKMCSDDIMFLETLYRTPQMNVNKIIHRECQISDECIQYYNKDSLEKVLSESTSHEDLRSDLEPLVSEVNYLDPTDSAQNKNIKLEEQTNENNCNLTKEFFSSCETYDKNENSNESHENLVTMPHKTQDDTVHSCESSIDDVFSFNQRDEYTTYTSSTSPEVSSTTSEERNSSILLKITNYKGSRISQINSFEQETRSISCKFTELNDYSSSQNFKSNRPLVTKAAQKYIPPLKETFGDLKIKLPLPQHSLLRLKQLKLLKEETKLNKCNIKSKPDIPKKPKPKFEDVLKSIDEIQFKMHKEKNKKTKKSIPKVVIKKNENGSHYASMASRESFNPDLTGRKWQPWVFLEKNHFIDKMALRNKRMAIFNHRKNAYVLAEKFRKYKSIGNAKFIISQPNLHNSTIGHLKCTIRLKHTY